MNRKAVSEIVAALMVITIAAGIGIGLYVFSLNFFSNTRSNFELMISESTLREKERFMITYAYYDESAGKLYVYIYNYGEIEVKIAALYIDNELINQTKMLVLPDKIKEYVTVKSLESGVHNLKIVSERGVRYETKFKA